MSEAHSRALLLRYERERWERNGRQPIPCPDCPATRLNPDTMRVHRALAHGVSG